MVLKRLGLEYGFYPVSGNILHTTPQDIDFLNFDVRYNYIIYTVSNLEKMNIKLYAKHIKLLQTMLEKSGRLLVCVPNRFGAKYLCGEPCGSDRMPFDGICGETNRLGREELLNILYSAGFKYVKLYYPFPDADFPNIVYTDDCLPKDDIREKLYSNITNTGARVLEEKAFIEAAALNGFAHLTVNSFIAECSDVPCEKIIYSCITSNRRRERAFVTNIYNDNTVRKIPIYDEGISGLEKLRQNTVEMALNGIPVLPIEIENNNAVMKKVTAQTLSEVLRDCVKKGKEELLKYTDRLYEYILTSSEHISAESNAFIDMAPKADWGVILKKAYIEMIPVNCFIENGEFLFFDQEYSIENCPARYVMSRAVADIYSFIPEVANVISEYEMKKRYGLYELWQCFRNIEGNFFDKEVFSDKRHICISDDVVAIRKNRRMLKMNNEINERIYDPIEGLGERRIILFGSGKYADYYMDKYGKSYPPEFIVDNNSEKLGTYKRGIEVKSPNELNKLIYGTYRVIIAVAQFEDIINQLESMGIDYHNYRIFSRYMEKYIPYSITDTMTDGKYNIGYVTGAFDLFHIGHLNILRRSKERCHYLIAGVLTDEIIIEEKKKTPFVPFEERIEIVKQCKYVDRVVAVDKHNTDKLDAFMELRYGCFFSGNDHNWSELKRRLVSLGSNAECFEYTKRTSSTMIQKAIEDSIKQK